MQRAIFLDRDGVINAMVYHPEFGLIDSPAHPEEFKLLPGVSRAVKMINELDYLAIIISNQPGVAKGKFTLQLLEATKEKMHHDLAEEGARVDDVYYCLHHPQASLESYRKICECRKPNPGLLIKAAEHWDLDLKESYFIGDGITDVVAGQRAGCKTFLVNSRKCYLCDEMARQQVQPDFIGKDLADAVGAIYRLENGDPNILDSYRFKCKISCD
jgi:D,D-heptose 1,7-bisphosphate phosphatase